MRSKRVSLSSVRTVKRKKPLGLIALEKAEGIRRTAHRLVEPKGLGLEVPKITRNEIELTGINISRRHRFLNTHSEDKPIGLDGIIMTISEGVFEEHQPIATHNVRMVNGPQTVELTFDFETFQDLGLLKLEGIKIIGLTGKEDQGLETKVMVLKVTEERERGLLVQKARIVSEVFRERDVLRIPEIGDRAYEVYTRELKIVHGAFQIELIQRPGYSSDFAAALLSEAKTMMDAARAYFRTKIRGIK